jgi:hypothetical protein
MGFDERVQAVFDGGGITKDVGKLPVDHPVIVFLADLMHRIRCFGKYVFGLALAPQSTSTCTMVDAYRLKRNFGCWILSYHTMTFDIFREKSKAVVEHHFNNHTHCGDWCAMKNADVTKAAIGELKYRCKKENKKMYEDISQIMDRFTETEKLKECHHGYSSQKNESMNRMISRYVPKDRTFCQSMSLHSRICMAVGIDSVGQEEYYERLFAGMRIPFPNATRMMARAMKKRRDYDRKYQAQMSRRRIRSIKRFASTKSEFRKQMAEKALGLSYASGMNMEVVEPGAKKRKVCKYCQGVGHLTTKARDCKYYELSKEQVHEEMVSKHALKVAETAVLVARAAATAVEGSEAQSEGTCECFGVCCDVDNMNSSQYSIYGRFLRRGIRHWRPNNSVGSRTIPIRRGWRAKQRCPGKDRGRNLRNGYYGF